VYITGKSGPERKPVVLGNKDGEMVEIRRGVSPADEVVLQTFSNDMQAKPAS
jgi:hypothetical protein